MNNIKTMTSEYRVACESGIVAGTRVEMASKRCEGVFAYGNTRSEHGFVPFSEGNGLLLKTNNYLRLHTTFMRRSRTWFADALRGAGTKTVRISAGTNRSDGVRGSVANCGVEGHCIAVAVA